MVFFLQSSKGFVLILTCSYVNRFLSQLFYSLQIYRFQNGFRHPCRNLPRLCYAVTKAYMGESRRDSIGLFLGECQQSISGSRCLLPVLVFLCLFNKVSTYGRQHFTFTKYIWFIQLTISLVIVIIISISHFLKIYIFLTTTQTYPWVCYRNCHRFHPD